MPKPDMPKPEMPKHDPRQRRPAWLPGWLPSWLPSWLKVAALGLALLWAAVPGSPAGAQEAPRPPRQSWSFNGVFGTFDRAALQRGFQVYKEVCNACHAIQHIFYRDLADLGYSEDQIKALAAGYTVTDGPNDQGQMFERPARPSDRFHAPFPNEAAARAANNSALPPDLSLMTKAREYGADHVTGILTGYKDPPPPGITLPERMYYNEYFPGHQIAMPPPLSEGQVTYADGTPATVPQMAHDVATFLSWAAEPRLEERHRTGFKVMLFLFVATGVFYAVKRKVWAQLH